jgi:hypothetical protein
MNGNREEGEGVMKVLKTSRCRNNLNDPKI